MYIFTYRLLGLLLVPIILLRLLWRSRHDARYHKDLVQRLGWVPHQASGGVWIHAVSLGEVNAASHLIETLQARGERIVLTTTTPAGWRRGHALDVACFWAPLDWWPCVALFLHRWCPRQLIIIETEIWPEWLLACRRRDIPVLLAGARLSRRSARRYAQGARWLHHVLRDVCLAARHRDDARRWRALGVEVTATVGTLKADLPLPRDFSVQAALWRKALGDQPYVLAASTHFDEEAQLLAALQHLPHKTLGLILAPRHVERSDALQAWLAHEGIPCVRRSANAWPKAGEVLLLDTHGELLAACSVATVVFVGGSLIPHGGQNPLEPARLGCAVLFGPHTFNFSLECRRLLCAGAAHRVANVAELVVELNTLLADPSQVAVRGQAAQAVFAAEQGATERVVALLRQQRD